MLTEWAKQKWQPSLDQKGGGFTRNKSVFATSMKQHQENEPRASSQVQGRRNADCEVSQLGVNPPRKCRLEANKKLAEFASAENEDSASSSESEAAASRTPPPISRGQAKTKKPRVECTPPPVTPLSEYELMRNENMRKNEEVMRLLGLETAATSVNRNAKGGQSRGNKRAKADYDENDAWSARNAPTSSDEDDVDARVVRKRPSRQEPGSRVMPPRAGKQPPLKEHEAGATLGSELEGRQIKVEIFTEDIGAKAWHMGEILRHRRRKGRDEHLVRWDTEGAEDEWLYLPEEVYHMFAPGEEEEQAAPQESEFRPGDCVVLLAEDEAKGGSKSRTSYARLIERKAGGAWSVHWFYQASDIPRHILDSKHGRQLDAKKEICYSIHEQDVDEETFHRKVEVIFTAAGFRTVTKDQKVCTRPSFFLSSQSELRTRK